MPALNNHHPGGVINESRKSSSSFVSSKELLCSTEPFDVTPYDPHRN